jgi:hypothetical protein
MTDFNLYSPTRSAEISTRSLRRVTRLEWRTPVAMRGCLLASWLTRRARTTTPAALGGAAPIFLSPPKRPVAGASVRLLSADADVDA